MPHGGEGRRRMGSCLRVCVCVCVGGTEGGGGVGRLDGFRRCRTEMKSQQNQRRVGGFCLPPA